MLLEHFKLKSTEDTCELEVEVLYQVLHTLLVTVVLLGIAIIFIRFDVSWLVVRAEVAAIVSILVLNLLAQKCIDSKLNKRK